MPNTHPQVLSDPNLRSIYNKNGQKKGGGGVEPAGGFQDPEVVFGTMFGGERFQDWIGTISIGKDMKDALENEQEQQTEMAQVGPPFFFFVRLGLGRVVDGTCSLSHRHRRRGNRYRWALAANRS